MKTYRDFYNQLQKRSSASLFRSAWPSETDDLLREQGIDVQGYDVIQISTAALLVYYAMKIRELEQRIAKLEK